MDRVIFVHVLFTWKMEFPGDSMSAEGTPTNLLFSANTTAVLTISGLDEQDTPAIFRFETRCVGARGDGDSFSLMSDGETSSARP